LGGRPRTVSGLSENRTEGYEDPVKTGETQVLGDPAALQGGTPTEPQPGPDQPPPPPSQP
jgi:hypothetical protein